MVSIPINLIGLNDQSLARLFCALTARITSPWVSVPFRALTARDGAPSSYCSVAVSCRALTARCGTASQSRSEPRLLGTGRRALTALSLLCLSTVPSPACSERAPGFYCPFTVSFRTLSVRNASSGSVSTLARGFQPKSDDFFFFLFCFLFFLSFRSQSLSQATSFSISGLLVWVVVGTHSPCCLMLRGSLLHSILRRRIESCILVGIVWRVGWNGSPMPLASFWTLALKGQRLRLYLAARFTCMNRFLRPINPVQECET